MKFILTIACSILILSSIMLAEGGTQTFATSAGPVLITPLNHASTRIEAGGKVIYLDPVKPVDFSKAPKADLILITDIHGDHMDPGSVAAVSKTGTEIISSAAVAKTVTAAKALAKEDKSNTAHPKARRSRPRGMAVYNRGARMADNTSVKRSGVAGGSAIPPRQTAILRCNCPEIRAIGTAVNLR